MKYVFVFAAVLLAIHGSHASVTQCSLTEAIQKKLVSINVHGAKPDTSGWYISSHVGPCMAMEISSSSANELKVSLDYGYRLEPEDTSEQTMMVTQNLLVHLAPKQKKSYRIYAMCTEAHDGAPSTETPFNLGKRFSGNLLSLAELINRKKYQSNAAQNAVWCLTNDYDLTGIWDNDTAQMYDLRRFVAHVKGLPLASVYAVRDDATPQLVMHRQTIYSGSLSYSIVGSSKVTIALYDEDGHMKIVYVNNEMQREGQYTYNYQVTSDEMNNKKHYLRMFRDGRLEEEITILPRE